MVARFGTFHRHLAEFRGEDTPAILLVILFFQLVLVGARNGG